MMNLKKFFRQKADFRILYIIKKKKGGAYMAEEKCCKNCERGYQLSIVDKVQCLINDELMCENDVCDSWRNKYE